MPTMPHIEPPEGFDPATEEDPSVPYDSELPPGEPRHAFDDSTRAVAALRINALCEAAGLVDKGQPGTEAMHHLARLVAQQCLDVLQQPETDQFDHAAMIEQLFAVQSSLQEHGAGIAFRVTLCNAPHLSAARTSELQTIFTESLMATFGDGEAVFDAYDAWVEGDGDRWLAAQNTGHVAVLRQVLPSEGESLALGRELGAHFELEFIRDC